MNLLDKVSSFDTINMEDQKKVSRFDQVPYPYKFAAPTAKPKRLLRVPLCRQATDYTCGISCLQSILAYWGHEYREDNLAELLKTDPEHGADQNQMVAFVKTLGFEATNEFGFTIQKLKDQIDLGIPVIVLYQAWTEEDLETIQWEKQMNDGHYSVAIGYCDENIYFMDPSTLGMYAFIPIDEFDKRWHNEDPPGNFEDHNAISIWRNEPAWFDPNKFSHID